MKVEFSAEEVGRMLDTVIDSMEGLKLDKTDRAKLRRWRAESLSPSSPALALLAEKVNGEIQKQHDLSEVSPIKKPDWAV